MLTALNRKLRAPLIHLGLWLTFWLMQAMLKPPHPWFDSEGRWRFSFAEWRAGATPVLKEYGECLAVLLIGLGGVLLSWWLRR